MVIESFLKNQMCHIFWRMQIACTKFLSQELMVVSGLWNLNKKKVKELLYLLVFVWSPRSERWPIQVQDRYEKEPRYYLIHAFKFGFGLR